MSKPTTIDEMLHPLSEDRKTAMNQLRKVIKKNLSKDFKEGIQYGMICYHVPHSKYPNGYHCDPKQPLPFLSIASQKNFIAVYHMGMYMSPELNQWFTEEYAKRVKGKLDMGKSCIRFKKPDLIPFDLIGELCTKMNADQWIDLYESKLKK